MQSKRPHLYSLKLRLGVGLIQTMARIPDWAARAIARLSSRWMWLLNGRLRQVTETNLAICFPDLRLERRQALARASLSELSSSIVDLARCWERSGAELEARIDAIVGREYLDDAVSAGAGTLVLLPHLGSWEIVSLFLSRNYTITALYRQPKTAVFGDYIRQRRERHGATLVPIGTAGLRTVHKALQAKEMVLLFPDQVPTLQCGQFAPFFGEPTLTMTLTTRLIGKSRAKAVCAYCKRLPHGRYELVFRPVDEAIYDADPLVALGGLNRSVEACVLECPEQYQWEYKRFKFLPDRQKRDYFVRNLGHS